MGIKLYLREPVAFFFTIIFAPLMLLLFGSVYGNEPNPLFSGRGTVDVMVPAYIGIIIVTVSLLSIPTNTASARESGVLRRFQAAPLHPLAYMTSELISNLVVTVLGVLFLILIGRLVYNARFNGNILSVSAAFLLGIFAFFFLGYLIAALAPTARTAEAVGMILGFPMIFFSGASVPWEILPSGVRAFGRYLPLTHLVSLLKGLWFGDPWSQHLHEVAVLLAILLLGGAIGTKLFRWE